VKLLISAIIANVLSAGNNLEIKIVKHSSLLDVDLGAKELYL
jgi:hypothetical protein